MALRHGTVRAAIAARIGNSTDERYPCHCRFCRLPAPRTPTGAMKPTVGLTLVSGTIATPHRIPRTVISLRTCVPSACRQTRAPCAPSVLTSSPTTMAIMAIPRFLFGSAGSIARRGNGVVGRTIPSTSLYHLGNELSAFTVHRPSVINASIGRLCFRRSTKGCITFRTVSGDSTTASMRRESVRRLGGARL